MAALSEMTVNLRPFADFSGAKLSPDSEDRLVEGTGPVKVQLTGADFEFVSKVALVPSPDTEPGGSSTRVSQKNAAHELSIVLRKDNGAGEQPAMEVELDTSELHAGTYLLKLTQTNGSTHDVGIVVHPPNPRISSLPLRVNLGEPQQTVTLLGTGLERIDGLYSEGATWMLSAVPGNAPNLHERKATIQLLPQVKEGDRLDASMKVRGFIVPVKNSGPAGGGTAAEDHRRE